LLAIVNEPYEDLTAKFTNAQNVFTGWGYNPSEDVELSAAYLAVSDLPIEGVQTKLAIIAKGLGTYLMYPLVAASILTSIPVLEANDTLNLLEQGYEIIGQRAMPATPPELICLAVRMVHGIRSETISGLDTTATKAPVTPNVANRYYYGPRFFFMPMIVAHGAYYATFGGFGGAHPAFAHASMGGFAGGGGGGGAGGG
jgi:hypothetical protein